MNPDRFLLHVDKTPKCWLWTGSLNGCGYGRLRVHGRLHAAHRIAYELWVGPIPSGALVRHRKGCAEKACVRPDHLELLPQAVRLTHDQIEAIGRSFLTRSRLSQTYGVTIRHIYRVRREARAT